MSEKLGKWYPSDLDGGIHYCEAKKQFKQELTQYKVDDIKDTLRKGPKLVIMRKERELR